MKQKLLIALLIMVTALKGFSQQQTGTLKIFSEFDTVSVYLDENFLGKNVKEVKDVPVGGHYLKVVKDGVSVYGEIVTITQNVVTTVLVKNSGQVQEKILDSKTNEQQEYLNSKLDVILSRGMTTSTKGYSNLFPGYYSYWGVSNSVSTSTETTDWKIIKGSVKEISEREFASITGNQPLMDRILQQEKSDNKRTGIGAAIALPTIIMSTILLTDMVGSKPWLHKSNPTHPKWEGVTLAICLPTAVISYLITMKKPYSGHYTTVDDAAKNAQDYNKKLKKKLGLPDSYDLGK